MVGNEDTRLPPAFVSEVGLQMLFRDWVEGRSGLVQQQNLPRAQQRTGDGDALCLSLAQPATLFVQRGVDALGKVEDKVGYGRATKIRYRLCPKLDLPEEADVDGYLRMIIQSPSATDDNTDKEV